MESPRFATGIMLQRCPKAQSNQIRAHGTAMHQRMTIHTDIVGNISVHTGREQTPNDPKLSDRGAWRGSCVMERSEGIRPREKGGSDETGSS